MGASGKATPTSNPSQRVKVYRLTDDGKWDDQGTGHVIVDYFKRTEELGLIVIDEEDNETMLVHQISSNEIYRRQEDTIISWRDSKISTDLALSFQEPVGCSYIWDQIIGIQRDLQFNTIGNDRVHGANTELRKLPSVELSTLPVILKNLLDCGIVNHMQVAELILQDKDFFPRLLDIFQMCEDLEDMDNLYIISKLVKTIIFLNSPRIFEKVFGDEFIMDIIGALEYDAEFPKVQSHRDFLKKHVIFKEAIPIKRSILLSKIHQTYRINYIKDVILPRALDEGTMTSLNSIINSNNATVVSSLKDDTSFIHDLFTKMKSSSTSAESKKMLVFFLQEFCSLGKSLPLVHQLRLYRDFASEGAFDVITEALLSYDKKLISAGTDILILFLGQDPNLLRTYITQQNGLPLFGLLVKGVGEDTHCQFLEIIRILLDSCAPSITYQRDAIVEIFYESHLDQLIEIINSGCTSENTDLDSKFSLSDGKVGHNIIKPEIMLNICELLCFCVLRHPYKIRGKFLPNNILKKVMYLIRRREKYLKVSAVRFMRTIISCKDEQLFQHIVTNNLLKPVIDSFVSNGNNYNMLHSGVLDLLEYIRKVSIKTLIKYIVETFWDQLSKFEKLETVHGLKIRYDQSLEAYNTKPINGLVESRKHTREGGLEKEEEDYFNADSDEDSVSAVSTDKLKHYPKPNLSNGRTSGLVDYDDDDGYNPPQKKIESSIENNIVARPLSKRKSVSIKDTNAANLEIKKKGKLNSHKIKSAVAVAACTTRRQIDSHGKIKLPLPPDISAVNKRSVQKSDACCSDGMPSNADIKYSISDEGPPLEDVSNDTPSTMHNAADIKNRGKDEVSPSLCEIPNVADSTLSSSGEEGSSNHVKDDLLSETAIADDIGNSCHEKASPIKPTVIEIIHSDSENEEPSLLPSSEVSIRDAKITNSELYPVR